MTAPGRAPAHGLSGAVLLLLGAGLAACGSGSSSGTATPGTIDTRAGRTLSGDINVFAAASLTDTFTALGDSFSAAHPDVTVVLNLAGSSALATQINQGAPGDLFAAASPATMQTAVDAGGAAGDPEVFARNSLQIAVPPGNPGGITALADLSDDDLTIALCAVEVPCGAAAATVFEAAGLTPAPDTLEQDVRAALTKVELGEVDAALVYTTDVLAAGDAVEGIRFPESEEAVSDYQIVVLAEAPNPDAAHAFVDHVRSEEGRRVLTDAGFDVP